MVWQEFTASGATRPDSAMDLRGELNMKLSEAILLGSTVVHPRAGNLRFPRTDEGCALGMAAIAVGCRFGRPLRQIPVKDLRTANIESVFGHTEISRSEINRQIGRGQLSSEFFL